VVALVLLTTGCGSSMTCGLVGCASVAQVRLDGLSPTMRYPLAAHACFDERCADLTIGQEPPAPGASVSVPCPGSGGQSCVDLRSTEGYVGIMFGGPPAGGRVHTAGLQVRDAGDAVVISSSQPLRLVKVAPNGERCGPVCWSGTADFTASG